MYYSCIYSRNCIGYFPLWRCHSGLSKIIWSVLTMKYINYRQEVFYVSLTTQIASIPRDVVHPRIISGLLVEELFIHFLPNFQTNSSTISTEVNFISVRVVTVLWSCLCTWWLYSHSFSVITHSFSVFLIYNIYDFRCLDRYCKNVVCVRSVRKRKIKATWNDLF